jgi:hypothetical protein
MKVPEPPDGIEPELLNKCLDYLDRLRERRQVDMFETRPYLQEKFPDLTPKQAAEVLGYWLRRFIGIRGHL